MIDNHRPQSRFFIEPLELRISPATLLVTNFADSGTGSLREAINQANGNPGADTINFKSGGTIKLQTPLPIIADDLTIDASKTVTIDGQGKVQLLRIGGTGTDVTLNDLKLTNGISQQGGAIIINAPTGNILVENSTLSGNKAVGDNSGPVGGGAISNLAGLLTIDSCQITGNKASAPSTAYGSTQGTNVAGGAIVNFDSLTIRSTIKTTKIANNSVSGDLAQGGAILNGSKGTMTLDQVLISGNTSQGANGISGANGTKGANGSNCYIPGYAGYNGQTGSVGGDGGKGGTAAGGAIANYGVLSISNSKLTANSVAGGKGGNGGNGGAGGDGGKGGPSDYAHAAGPKGLGGTGGFGGKQGKGGPAHGGGIYNGLNASLTIVSTEISGNSVKNGLEGTPGKGGAGGHGRINGPSGQYWIVKTPGAGAYGGGIDSFGTLSIDNSTISKNQVQGGNLALGGGITSAGPLTINNSTIASNSLKAKNGINGVNGHNAPSGYNGQNAANGSAGGVAFGAGIYNINSATLQSCIITGNTLVSGNGGNGGKGGNGGSWNPNHGIYYGGSGGNGGNAGGAGSAAGGGICSSGANSALVIQDTTISNNLLTQGKAGKPGTGGKAGFGMNGYHAGVNGQEGAQAAATYGDGGGIFCKDGTLALTRLNILNNIATVQGGGVAVEQSSSASIWNSQINGNHAGIGGGLFVIPDAVVDQVKVGDSAITSNFASVDPDISAPDDSVMFFNS